MWAIENPATGLLKTRSFMEHLPWLDVTHCQYGTPYRKQTRLWTNVLWRPYSIPAVLCDALAATTELAEGLRARRRFSFGHRYRLRGRYRTFLGTSTARLDFWCRWAELKLHFGAFGSLQGGHTCTACRSELSAVVVTDLLADLLALADSATLDGLAAPLMQRAA